MTAQFGTIRKGMTKKKMSFVKPEKKPISDETFAIRQLDYYSQMYTSLSTFRKEIERATRYFNGDQWHEITKDRYGNEMREDAFISSQGQVPIKQNIIKPAIRTLQGQFRSNTTKSVVVARTPEKGKESEMLSNTLQYNLASVNDSKEIDAMTLEKFMISGLAVQRLNYEYHPDLQRKDVILRDMNLYSLFFNGDIEDVRGYDLNCIGRLMDLSLAELRFYFGGTPQRAKKLEEIYKGHADEYWTRHNALDPKRHYSKDFYVTDDVSKCRVIEVWEKRIVQRMEVHDWMDGEVYYTDWTEKDIEALNADRIAKFMQVGVPAEEVLLMEGTLENVAIWYYTFYSPFGHILEEGESPFKHGTHPFVFYIHKISDGKISGLVSDLIDTQRLFNRLHILQDRILASSVKNTLIVDRNAMDGKTKEEIGDDMKEVGGVVVLDIPKGQNVQNSIYEMKGSIGQLGIPEMIQMYVRTLQDVSGVHPAMQGQSANSGTSGKLYQQEAQNSTLNSKDIMDSFAAGQRRRDMKLLKTIQQYYDKPVMIAIGGKSYTETAQLYDPEKIKDLDFDLTLGQTSDSPIYRSIMDDQLFQLLNANMIDLELFLENVSTPYSSQLLESVRNRKRELEQNPQGAVAGLAQDVQAAGVGGNQQVVDQTLQGIRR